MENAFGSSAGVRSTGSVNVPFAICDVDTKNVVEDPLTADRIAVSAESCWLAPQTTDPRLAGGTHVLAASVPFATGSRIRKLSSPVAGSERSSRPASPLPGRAEPPDSVRYSSRDDRTTWVIWLSDCRNDSTAPSVAPAAVSWLDVTNPSVPSVLTPNPEATLPPSAG